LASSTASASPTGASVLIVDDHPADRRVSRVPVLLVEDNEVNQRVARHMLRKSGYLATVVENGEEAIAAVMRERFDIVLMDVQMPVLGGLEAARRIRELEAAWTPPSSGESSGNSFGGRRLQIIAMTAYAMKGDRELCLAAGMDDYVAKPIKCQRADRIGNKSARTDISITLPADHRMSIVLQHRPSRVCPPEGRRLAMLQMVFTGPFQKLESSETFPL
jgi:CheY-like chemotaxis protein